MSQRAVEAVLGRLITDVEFRVRFFAEPDGACRENDLGLTPRETEALLQVSVQGLHHVAAQLDPKIVRAAIPGNRQGAARDLFEPNRVDQRGAAPDLRRE